MTKLDLAHLAEGLEIAKAALEAAPHGDNCFLHSDGGEYDRCFCGKDSVVAHLEGLLGRVILDAPEVEIEQAREIVRRALHAADNGNHAGELAVVKMAQAASELSRLQAEIEGLRKALQHTAGQLRRLGSHLSSHGMSNVAAGCFGGAEDCEAALAPNGEVGA